MLYLQRVLSFTVYDWMTGSLAADLNWCLPAEAPTICLLVEAAELHRPDSYLLETHPWKMLDSQGPLAGRGLPAASPYPAPA
ncbi:hypothetical protein [Rhizosaccharibacter radicis]|uniref:Uncharacterized protein n=1 Tax=Rhizosaccharibacter radicis TaxID=2782605 RepID=A0ABT1VWD3_9PROT|nr:hypothetical protein [Acetobacteraceae bacterium KSS12]